MIRRTILGASLLAAGTTVGCAGYPTTGQVRPDTVPSPPGVAAEIRDARYFLAIPADAAGPATGFRPAFDDRDLVP